MLLPLFINEQLTVRVEIRVSVHCATLSTSVQYPLHYHLLDLLIAD